MPAPRDPQPPLPYRAPSDARDDYVDASATPRSKRKWALLLLVWLLGAAVMTVYVVLLALLAYRYLS